MTIDEVKIEQAKLLAIIDQAVKNFESTTGLTIDGIFKRVYERQTKIGVFSSFSIRTSYTLEDATATQS